MPISAMGAPQWGQGKNSSTAGLSSSAAASPSHSAFAGSKEGGTSLPQLGQGRDVDVEDAEVVVLEAAGLTLALGTRQAVQAFGLEDAVHGVAGQVGQDVGDHEGEVVEGDAGGLAPRAPTMARSSSLAFQGSLGGRAERSRQASGPRLRQMRMVSGETP